MGRGGRAEGCRGAAMEARGVERRRSQRWEQRWGMKEQRRRRGGHISPGLDRLGGATNGMAEAGKAVAVGQRSVAV